MNANRLLARSIVTALVCVVSSIGMFPATAQQKTSSQSNFDALPQWTRNSVVKGNLVSSKQETTPANPINPVPQNKPTTPQDNKQGPPKLDDTLNRNLQDQIPNLGNVGQQPPGFRARPKPQKIVEEQFAGWRQAGEGYNGDRLVDTLRANWVMVNPSGGLQGSVANYAPSKGQKRPMKIHLLSRGLLINTANVNSDGTFRFTGMKEAAYTIIGVSENQFFAFSFNAIPYQAEIKNAPGSINVVAMPATIGFTVAWLERFAPLVKFRNYGVFKTKQAAADPARLYGLKGLSTAMPNAIPATSIQAHAIMETSDGRVLGRIHQLTSLSGRPVDVLNTTVALTKGTEVVAHTSTDNYGVFEFKNIEPGNYGLFAAGDDGIGAMGIQIVENQKGASGVIDFTLATSESIGWINHTLKEEDYLNRILQPRPEMSNFNPNCGGQCGWCSLLKSLYGPQRDYSKSYGCYRDNKLFHQNCRGGNCGGACGGCQTGQCQGGCQTGHCQGGCQTGQCQGGCQTGQCQGGCQSGGCQNNNGQQNGCGCGQQRPNPCLGAAFKKCPKCEQYQSECRCHGRPAGCPTCQGAAFQQGGVMTQGASPPAAVPPVINNKK